MPGQTVAASVSTEVTTHRAGGDSRMHEKAVGPAEGSRRPRPLTRERLSAPTMLWRSGEAGHVRGFQARPQEYEQHVTRFFDRALLGKE